MAKYSAKAAAKVKTAMEEMKSGKLKIGQSDEKVTNPKQAIAIGLSEARAEGAKMPAPPKKSVAAKKAAPKKATAKKAATAQKSPAAKKATPKKAAKKTAKKMKFERMAC